MSEERTRYGDEDAEQKAARELLEQRIRESGLSQTQYAEKQLVRDPRTIRRWLAGDRPIPDVVIKWLRG